MARSLSWQIVKSENSSLARCDGEVRACFIPTFFWRDLWQNSRQIRSRARQRDEQQKTLNRLNFAIQAKWPAASFLSRSREFETWTYLPGYWLALFQYFANILLSIRQKLETSIREARSSHANFFRTSSFSHVYSFESAPRR